MSYNLSICPIEINNHCSLGELLNETTVSYNSSLPADTPVLGNNSFATAFSQLRACERIKEEMDREYEICQEKETTDCKCYEKVLPLKREFEDCTGKASTGDTCFIWNVHYSGFSKITRLTVFTSSKRLISFTLLFLDALVSKGHLCGQILMTFRKTFEILEL